MKICLLYTEKYKIMMVITIILKQDYEIMKSNYKHKI